MAQEVTKPSFQIKRSSEVKVEDSEIRLSGNKTKRPDIEGSPIRMTESPGSSTDIGTDTQIHLEALREKKIVAGISESSQGQPGISL